MPSITTWARLEPQTAADDIATGFAARVHDPLWLLARQWQVGEFQGEDAGTPIVARWRARVTPMTRYVAGTDPAEHPARCAEVRCRMPCRWRRWSSGSRCDSRRLVDGLDGLRLAVESGQHFLRLLRLQATTTSDHTPLS